MCDMDVATLDADGGRRSLNPIEKTLDPPSWPRQDPPSHERARFSNVLRISKMCVV